MIFNSKIGDTIELPDEEIEINSLIIDKPLTLVGRPGSVIHVNGGTIVVSFAQHEDEGSVSLSKIILNQQHINAS